MALLHSTSTSIRITSALDPGWKSSDSWYELGPKCRSMLSNATVNCPVSYADLPTWGHQDKDLTQSECLELWDFANKTPEEW